MNSLKKLNYRIGFNYLCNRHRWVVKKKGASEKEEEKKDKAMEDPSKKASDLLDK